MLLAKLVTESDYLWYFLKGLQRLTIHRTRFSSRRRQFFDIPQRANVNSDNDIITTSVIAWSFYPKLLIRDGKGFRNVANNQSISLHPTSVNKGHHDLKWLSYYHIMQAKQYVQGYLLSMSSSSNTYPDFIMHTKQRQLKNLPLPCFAEMCAVM